MPVLFDQMGLKSELSAETQSGPFIRDASSGNDILEWTFAAARIDDRDADKTGFRGTVTNGRSPRIATEFIVVARTKQPN